MNKLRIVVPKGRIMKNVTALLESAGIRMLSDDRQYKPVVSDPEIEIKIMKPQNIPRLVELGSHDAGFTGLDWIRETNADVEELMDLEFDPVRIVAAAPEALDMDRLRTMRVVAASEYEGLATRWLKDKGLDFVLIRTFGATEVFPPEDADLIIDNTATGRTLEEHRLQILDTLMTSSTRFIANRETMLDPWKQKKLGRLLLLFNAIFNARKRVMLEMNVPADVFDTVLAELPSMRSPTVAPLHGEGGYSVKVAVRRDEAAPLVVRLKEMGARDILEYELKKVMA